MDNTNKINGFNFNNVGKCRNNINIKYWKIMEIKNKEVKEMTDKNIKQNLEHLIINTLGNEDTNIIVLDIKYLKKVQELYNQTYKAKSDQSEFRIISSYDIIDDKSMQIYVTDEYKEMILNDIDY